MTNSLNTPIEALEYSYPFRVHSYAYRKGSGGKGKFRGGDGLVREIELLTDSQVTLLSDRRRLRPYGLSGGEPGASGRGFLFRANGRALALGEPAGFAKVLADSATDRILGVHILGAQASSLIAEAVAVMEP